MPFGSGEVFYYEGNERQCNSCHAFRYRNGYDRRASPVCLPEGSDDAIPETKMTTSVLFTGLYHVIFDVV
jgi:hypothetical protein